MELKAVKKYNKAKYPTDEEVKEDKELLLKPLDKWKKVGITSGLLAILLVSEGIVRAMDYVDGYDSYDYVGGMDSRSLFYIELYLANSFEEKFNLKDKYQITLTNEEMKTMAQDLEKTLKENENISGEHLWCVLYYMRSPRIVMNLPDGSTEEIRIGYALLQYFDDDFIKEMLSNASSYYLNEMLIEAPIEFKRKSATYFLDNIDKEKTIEKLAGLSQYSLNKILDNGSTEQKNEIERKIKQYNFKQFIKESIPKNNFAFSKDNLRKAQFESTSDNFYENFISWLLVQGLM